MNKSVYLAGPMEYSSNYGRGWREVYSKDLEEYLGFSCIIPEEREQIITNQQELDDLKHTDIDRYINIMRQLIELDLKFIEDVDLVIVRWEGERMSGTIHEVGYAYQIGKPCYLVTSKPLYDVPGWFLSCFTEVFESFSCLLLHLSELYLKKEKE